MSISLQQLGRAELAEIPVTIRNAGVAGAGGAGFPTYAKWEHLDHVDYLMVNHQESEPNYYIDKWLGRKHAEELATLFDALLDRAFDVIVVGAKEKDRERWMSELESATGGAVYGPDDLPLDPEAESGIVFAYTDDRYEYGMENVLLRMVSDTVIGKDLPTDHGWIVQNTETMYNIYRTLAEGKPVTDKFVHVDGTVPHHRFLEVPVGTTATDLLMAAGLSPSELRDDDTLLDGGPGWCFKIDESPDTFGVRKRTNCVLVANRDVVEANRRGTDRINVLNEGKWGDTDHETEPTATLFPVVVHVPLITNPAFEGIVSPSRPIVEQGDDVSKGEMIATPGNEGFSNPQHASIDGVVTDVTDEYVEITHEALVSETGVRERGPAGRMIYWTWCIECGSYVVMPETGEKPDPTHFICKDCR